ncbi:hypothetical protein R1flu_022781 [Riccia fluitans]|uniref:Glucose-6-phosphate dehydrogenase C-terminal domain-containing protein n=1 Tax=Riccia fluitans TaxID=41844 RepID=A0ABD1XQ83_9MARC
MEPPVSLDGEDIRNEKVKLLRCMRKPTFQDVVLGQYKASVSKDGKSKVPGYLDEHDVRYNSLTPTFMATIMYIDNARWEGVPFLVKAGKGLIKHTVEIRIQFRQVPGNLYRERFGFNLDAAANELVLRVQPDEAIYLKINNKLPGLGLQLDSSELNLLCRDKADPSHLVVGKRSAVTFDRGRSPGNTKTMQKASQLFGHYWNATEYHHAEPKNTQQKYPSKYPEDPNERPTCIN